MRLHHTSCEGCPFTFELVLAQNVREIYDHELSHSRTINSQKPFIVRHFGRRYI